MTAYWPYAAAVVCLLSVVRCAARQHCGLRSLLGGAVCGLGVLALLGLLEPITGISLPLNRFTVPVVETRIEGETCKYFSAFINADKCDGFI